MNDTVISCRKLAKRYSLARRSQETLRDSLARVISRGSGEPRIRQQEIIALGGIDLDVRRGTVLGVVGANGAGKSTLLKILARVTSPTSGSAELVGSVGSLLEVGTGFHPELTGHENIFLSAAILGMDRNYVKKMIDEIVAFSDCEAFLDVPVKHYSSGMYMRLAFAVAAHLETEILLVDEVLAVGDTRFQSKCLGKLSTVAHDGRTVVFVSHNMVAIEGLCDRVIWIDRGHIAGDGPPNKVVGAYLTEPGVMRGAFYPDAALAPGTEFIKFRSASARPLGAGVDNDAITMQTPIRLEFEYWVRGATEAFTLAIKLVNKQGTIVFSSGLWVPESTEPALYHAECVIPGELLNEGLHHVDVSFDSEDDVLLHYPNAISFTVLDDNHLRQGYFGEWPGAVRVNVGWKSSCVERSAVQFSPR